MNTEMKSKLESLLAAHADARARGDDKQAREIGAKLAIYHLDPKTNRYHVDPRKLAAECPNDQGIQARNPDHLPAGDTDKAVRMLWAREDEIDALQDELDEAHAQIAAMNTELEGLREALRAALVQPEV